MTERSAGGTERVGADENTCLSCGWTETPARKNYRKCPECGAPFQSRYTQRVFVNRSVATDTDQRGGGSA